ncbi:MAG: hypothetical protein KDB79_11390 [Acidobacteria bacterium]|nr:hypothetical protein [Acidobacteriota bacterium]
MNTLFTIFIAVGAFGFLFLLISLVIGDIFEHLDFSADHDFEFEHELEFDHELDGSHGGHYGIINSRVLSVFLTAFGVIGAAALQFGFGGLISVLFGIGGGLVLGAVVFAFGYFLYSQQASSSITIRDMIGRTAEVTVAIEAGTVGQISCRIGEETVEKLARSRNGEEIKRGTSVFIEEITPDEFIVSPMNDYLLIDE